jgi:ADP-dependent NAD(P)H-hydrate dehydratase / NAD(P)H-hydrate epimerase
MRLPKPLLRQNKSVHKNDFGHVLVVAGSPAMLGAACLTALSSMRSGAGLVTVAVPKSLNLTLQKKLSSVLMTLPVKETKAKTFSPAAFDELMKCSHKFNAVALGPGIGMDKGTQRFVLEMIRHYPLPMVVDADALNALSQDLPILLKAKAPRILTPHVGEMARLSGMTKKAIEHDRKGSAVRFAKAHRCVLVLKGAGTVVASPDGKVYVNKTGNAGMATAGSGDVLTGVIAAFLAQGILPFESAHWGAFFHGAAGDRAAQERGSASLIATDIIDHLDLRG